MDEGQLMKVNSLLQALAQREVGYYKQDGEVFAREQMVFKGEDREKLKQSLIKELTNNKSKKEKKDESKSKK